MIRASHLLLLSLLALLVAASSVGPADAVSRADARSALNWVHRSRFFRSADLAKRFRSVLNLRKKMRRNASPVRPSHNGKVADVFAEMILIALGQEDPITLFLPLDPYQFYTVASTQDVAALTTFSQDHMIASITTYADLEAADRSTEYSTVSGGKFKKVNSNLTRVVSLVGGSYLPTVVVWADAFTRPTLVIHIVSLAIIP